MQHDTAAVPLDTLSEPVLDHLAAAREAATGAKDPLRFAEHRLDGGDVTLYAVPADDFDALAVALDAAAGWWSEVTAVEARHLAATMHVTLTEVVAAGRALAKGEVGA